MWCLSLAHLHAQSSNEIHPCSSASALVLHRITDAGHVVWVYQGTRLFPTLHFHTPCTKRNMENKHVSHVDLFIATAISTFVFVFLHDLCVHHLAAKCIFLTLIRGTWGSTAWWLPAVPSAGCSSDPQETIQNMQLQQGEVGPEGKEEVQSTPSVWWMFGILSLV